MHNTPRPSVGMSTLLILSVLCALIPGCSGGPNPADLRLQTAAELLKRNKTHQARAQIEAAIQLDPSRSSTYWSAMRLYLREDLFSDAARTGELLLKRAESSKLDRGLLVEEKARLYIVLGSSYQSDDDLANAERTYKAALALAPDSPELLNALGYFYAEEGIKLDEALKLTARAVNLAPDAGHIVDSLGWAQYKLGRYKAAANTLKRAIELRPDDDTLRYHLGAAYAKQGRQLEAFIELKKALVLNAHMTDSVKLLKTLQK